MRMFVDLLCGKQNPHTHLDSSLPELSDKFELLLQQVLLCRRHQDLHLGGPNLLC